MSADSLRELSIEIRFAYFWRCFVRKVEGNCFLRWRFKYASTQAWERSWLKVFWIIEELSCIRRYNNQSSILKHHKSAQKSNRFPSPHSLFLVVFFFLPFEFRLSCGGLKIHLHFHLRIISPPNWIPYRLINLGLLASETHLITMIRFSSSSSREMAHKKRSQSPCVITNRQKSYVLN